MALVGDDEVNRNTGAIIAAGIEVHRALGPGLMESAYLACMNVELRAAGLALDICLTPQDGASWQVDESATRCYRGAGASSTAYGQAVRARRAVIRSQRRPRPASASPSEVVASGNPALHAASIL
jgi:hypothetical protein